MMRPRTTGTDELLLRQLSAASSTLETSLFSTPLRIFVEVVGETAIVPTLDDTPIDGDLAQDQLQVAGGAVRTEHPLVGLLIRFGAKAPGATSNHTTTDAAVGLGSSSRHQFFAQLVVGRASTDCELLPLDQRVGLRAAAHGDEPVARRPPATRATDDIGAVMGCRHTGCIGWRDRGR